MKTTDYVRTDSVWMLWHPSKGFWYSPPATNAADAWDKARLWENAETATRQSSKAWKASMRAQGWATKKVRLVKD